MYPTYQKLGQYLNIEFIPYGFASYLPDGNGGWDFACQHGPNECTGNLYQACLINALKKLKNVILVNLEKIYFMILVFKVKLWILPII